MNITCNTKGNQREILSKLAELFPRLRWGSGRELLAYIPSGYINFENGGIYTLDCLTYGGAREVSQEVFFQRIAEYYGITLKKDSSIICDPHSPEAKALIGKRALFSDWYVDLCSAKNDSRLRVAAGVLVEIRLDQSCPFRRETGTAWTFIKALPEPLVEETQEVTMEEVCAKFGKNVKIKKGE